MSILIIGGNGFIGSHLVDRLAKSKQHRIVVLDIYPRAYEPLPEGVAFIQGNLDDIGLLRRVLIDQGVDVVYHLAWTTISETALENPVADIVQNLIPTVNLLDACLYAKVKRVVFVSSGGTVYGIPTNLPVREECSTNPISAYGITKLTAEKYIQMYQHLYGLEYVIFRPSVPYGPRQNPRRRQGVVSVFIYRSLQGQPIQIWGDGEILRDYFYVGDMIDALMAVLDTPDSTNTVFNLAGLETYTLNQLVNLIEGTLGVKAEVAYETERKFDVPKLQLDISAATDKLNWQPLTTLDEGIRRTTNWIQKWIA